MKEQYNKLKPKTLADYIKESHETAVSKGWWEPEKRIKSLCESCGGDGEVDSLISICSVCLGAGWIFTNFERSFSDQIALMHSELSEALEEYRNLGKYQETLQEIYFSGKSTINHEITSNHKPEGIAVELADVLIRIFDTCGRYNIPLEEALRLKLDYNKTRPHRHGGKKL